ncbi:MAG: hypothetical protein AABX65_03765 [Nanoarchaeota archaeon]
MMLIINICREKLHYLEFVKPIEDILKSLNIPFRTMHYEELDKKEISRADKVIICGTSLADNDFLKHLDCFSWIKGFKKPILGICGGMHILGIVFNGRLKKAKEIGITPIVFKKSFLGLSGEKLVYALHSLFVSSSQFDTYAVSKNCSQAIKHKTLPFYGVLFHPEVRVHSLITAFCTEV